MAASTYTDILEAIRQIIESITYVPGKDPGAVFDYEPWAITPKGLITLFKQTDAEITGDVIHAWTITRISTAEIEDTSGFNRRTYLFAIKGYMSLRDDGTSEKLFNQKVERICDIFRERFTGKTTNYGGVGQPGSYPNGVGFTFKPPQVIRVENVMLAETFLCHHAEIHLNVDEVILYS